MLNQMQEIRIVQEIFGLSRPIRCTSENSQPE